jgi:hypothetical protein
VFWFSLQLLSKTFLILRRIQRVIITNVHRYSCKVPVILVRFYWNVYFIDKFSRNIQISNFMKIRSVRAEFPMRTDRQDEANSRFSQFCEKAPKNQSREGVINAKSGNTTFFICRRQWITPRVIQSGAKVTWHYRHQVEHRVSSAFCATLYTDGLWICMHLIYVQGSFKWKPEKLYKVIYFKNRYSTMTLIFNAVPTKFYTPPPTFH